MRTGNASAVTEGSAEERESVTDQAWPIHKHPELSFFFLRKEEWLLGHQLHTPTCQLLPGNYACVQRNATSSDFGNKGSPNPLVHDRARCTRELVTKPYITDIVRRGFFPAEAFE